MIKRLKLTSALTTVAAFTALLGAGAASATTVASSTFDTDSDGWVYGLFSDATPYAGSQPLMFDGTTETSTGVGTITTSDPDQGNGDNAFVAPTKFLTAAKGTFQGNISFDLSDAEVPLLPSSALALISSNEPILYAKTVMTPSTISNLLTHYSIDLIADNFYIGSPDDQTAGTAATTDQLRIALKNLTQISIQVDWHNGDDFARLDNVVLSNSQVTPSVPEPATWAMLVSGFGLVGAGMRRRAGRMVQAI